MSARRERVFDFFNFFGGGAVAVLAHARVFVRVGAHSTDSAFSFYLFFFYLLYFVYQMQSLLPLMRSFPEDIIINVALMSINAEEIILIDCI